MKFKGSSGLFSVRLEHDDTKSDPPPDKILKGLKISKLQDSSQLQTITAQYNQEILRGGGERDHHRLRNVGEIAH